jgi:hypothetical protein
VREVIDKYSAIPFSYGLDCCQFVGECVESVTGKNPATNFLYSGEAEAMALIQSYGSLDALVTSVFGKPYDGQKDGDITVHNQSDGTQIAGVVYRGRSIVRTKAGLMDWPIDSTIGVWKT